MLINNYIKYVPYSIFIEGFPSGNKLMFHLNFHYMLDISFKRMFLWPSLMLALNINMGKSSSTPKIRTNQKIFSMIPSNMINFRL